MAKQALLWTALPNGYSADGSSLRLSLLLSPRLDAEAGPQHLATFPDFVDWPATLAAATLVIRFGGAAVTIAHDKTSPNRIDDRLGTPDSKAWKTLFPDPGKTFVQGYKFRDLSTHKVLSYPAAQMDGWVHDLYSGLAAAAQDQLPTASTILSDPGWGDLVEVVAQNDDDEKNVDFQNGLRDTEQQFKSFAMGFGNLSGHARDLALFQLFHTPPSKPAVGKYDVPPGDAREKARWRTYERTALPNPDDFQNQIDFHRIVAAMSQYPTLLRRLGLVVDVLIAKTAFSPTPSAALRAEVTLPPGSPGVTRVRDASPQTLARLDAARFQALPRPNPGPGDYRTVDGLLDLDPQVFGVLQADVDGGGLKVMNFARTLARLQQSPDQRFDPVTRQERQLGAPALRNAGLMLVHGNRGGMLEESFKRQKAFNDAAEQIQKGQPQPLPPPPVQYAEDLVRGWRIDVWDDKTSLWHSLCRRHACYDLNDGEVKICVPEEEGTVRLAATTSPDSNNQGLIWLHEALVSWTGWSLCAPAPGKTIRHHREPATQDPEKDHTDPVEDAAAEVPPGLHLRTRFTALPGSLPRLRYGRKYRMRVRVVDLAGNALAHQETDFGPEKPAAAEAFRYFRYEPIPPPALALLKPTPDTVEAPAEGESMERIAVRTFNAQLAGNTTDSAQTARRFAVPSRTTHREAEHHGLLDRNGAVDASFFAVLAAKDNSLAEEKILASGPLAASAPVETQYAAMQEGEALPYLPEPLAEVVAARLFDHPSFPSGQVIPIPLYEPGAAWPDAAPFKIEVYENPGDVPRFEAATRTLCIPLPKAERATLRLSVKPTLKALELLGIWSRLTPQQKASLLPMALDGKHWMLTPWRDIELVHAVQRPLIAPQVVQHAVSRESAATFARPGFIATCSIKSTDHLDLLASWNEPAPHVHAAGENRRRNDHAFTVKITGPQAYAGTPEYQLAGTDLVRTGGFLDDRISKVHEFHDTRYRRIEYWFEATTAFREFMPAELLTTDVDGKPVPTDEHIKVTGSPVRTWIPSSAAPPAPAVLYVVPTFGWVRAGDRGVKSARRRGGGLRVYLDGPWNVSGYGEMLAVVLPSASFKGDPNDDPSAPAQPLKSFVTQWGNDPIWLSPFVSGAAPKRTHFPLARTAADPAGKWLPCFAPPEEADQPLDPFTVTDLPHPELRAAAGGEERVEIAPHDVFYDEERQLWYCDIEVDWGAAYYPFIRLALARYQPVSVSGAHLSSIVLADFMALVPDRWLTVTRLDEGHTQRVSVFGSTYHDSSAHTEAAKAPAMSIQLPGGQYVTSLQEKDVAASSVIEVWVERFDAALGEDFGWQRESGALVEQDGNLLDAGGAGQVIQATQLLDQRQEALGNERLVDKVPAIAPLWEGIVTLPQAPEHGARYRLAIAEYEEYLVDGPLPYGPALTSKDRRLVFIEYVELG
jgi:hypothetical protein